MKASELDKKFDANKEDILHYFDLSSAKRINQKSMNVDFPGWIIHSLDKETNQIDITDFDLTKNSKSTTTKL